MDVAELISQFRTDSDDLKEAYLSSTVDVKKWLNEGEEEAAIRARLIYEADNAAVCVIAVTAGLMSYALHPSVLDITRATFTPTGTTTPWPLAITDRIERDRMDAGWRTITKRPEHLIQDDTRVTLGYIPDTNGELRIECYRLPLMLMEDRTDESPEIGRIHHRHLVQWALHRCYSRPDAEVFNPGKAAIALAEFTKNFGLRPNANYRRNYQANTPMHNKAVW